MRECILYIQTIGINCCFCREGVGGKYIQLLCDFYKMLYSLKLLDIDKLTAFKTAKSDLTQNTLFDLGTGGQTLRQGTQIMCQALVYAMLV